MLEPPHRMAMGALLHLSPTTSIWRTARVILIPLSDFKRLENAIIGSMAHFIRSPCSTEHCEKIRNSSKPPRRSRNTITILVLGRKNDGRASERVIELVLIVGYQVEPPPPLDGRFFCRFREEPA